MSAPQTATLLEVSPTRTVTWTMPRLVYELVAQMLEKWPAIYGRRPRATVERALDLLEQNWPGVRTGVTREERPAPEPKVRGHKATVYTEGTWLYRQWMGDAKEVTS